MFLSHALVALLATLITLVLLSGGITNRYTKLEQLQALIERYYIGESDEATMQDAAAHAMVDALGDRWSYYIPQSAYNAYQEQMNNAYVGIGVTISTRKDGSGLDVIAVTEGSSAQSAGIMVGDIITAVDGQSISGMGSEQVRNFIRGEVGTTVSISVKRGEEAHAFSVLRQEIQQKVAGGQMLSADVGLITIENFDSRCAEETIAAIQSVIQQGANKLIFDVRNNPGGYRDELVKVLDYLLPEGLVFRSEYYNGKTEEEFSDAKCLDLPMAVLVNGESYSAAEFFAVALKDYDRAFTVGEQTCGKGYFQTVYELQDGSAVGLSIGKYYTPKGQSLADIGIKPDIPVQVDEETAYAIRYNALEPENDPQIQAALARLEKE